MKDILCFGSFLLISLIVFIWFTQLSNNFNGSLLQVHKGEEHIKFNSWVTKFQKVYKTEEEKRYRQTVFKQSMIMVENHNMLGRSYSLELNQFADWTHEEFTQYYNLRPKSECWTTMDRDMMKIQKNEAELNFPFIPKYMDWRQHGIVSPVKNQGQCGSCWAFAAVGAIEAHLQKANGKGTILSEQQIIDCSFPFQNFGCNGGWPARAFEYVRYNGGLDTQDAYPYEMVSNKSNCRFQKSHVGAKIRGVVNITEYDERALHVAVGHVGPVSVAFVVQRDFHLYSGGVYSSPDCGKPTPNDLNHAVLIVGYGTSWEGKDYWIVKNSWGEAWGVKGYFMIERGTNMCGIADCASYPIVARCEMLKTSYPIVA